MLHISKLLLLDTEYTSTQPCNPTACRLLKIENSSYFNQINFRNSDSQLFSDYFVPTSWGKWTVTNLLDQPYQ